MSNLELSDILDAINKSSAKVEKTINDFGDKLDDIACKIDQEEIKQDYLEQALKDIKTTVDEVPLIKTQVAKLEDDIKNGSQLLRDAIAKQNLKIDDLETQIRRNNLVIKGLSDVNGEDRIDLAKKLETLFDDKLGVITKITASQVFRIGSYSNTRNRLVIYKAQTYDVKISILTKNTKLKGEGIYIEHDHTANQQKAKYEIRKYIKSNQAKTVKWLGTNVAIIDGQKIKYNYLSNLIENVV